MGAKLDNLSTSGRKDSEQTRIIGASESDLAESTQPEGNPSAVQWPTLDEQALHGLAGKIVREISPHTEADAAGLLVHLLAGVGNMMGRNAWQLVGGSRHFLNLFVACVGSTAQGRKGTALAEVKPLWKLADANWERQCVVGGLSTGEGLIWQVRDPIYRSERNKESGEVEDVLVDAGVEDKRLLVVESEMGSVLRRGGRDGNTLSAVMRQAWDADDVLKVMTKSNPAAATEANISIVGHITIEELRQELDRGSDVFNGFANRFLWCCVRRSKLLPNGGRLPEDALARLGLALSRVREKANSSVLGELRRDVEAGLRWAEVYPSLTMGRTGRWGAATSRAEAQVLRLSGLYAVMDCRKTITKPDIDAALALWKFCEQSAAFIFGPGRPQTDAEVDQDILLLAKHAGGELTSRDVMRSGLRRRFPTADTVMEAFVRMQSAGMGKVRYPARKPGMAGAPRAAVFVATRPPAKPAVRDTIPCDEAASEDSVARRTTTGD